MTGYRPKFLDARALKQRRIKYEKCVKYYNLSVSGMSHKDICDKMHISDSMGREYWTCIDRGGLIDKSTKAVIKEEKIPWMIPKVSLSNGKLKKENK